jgi:hypothetical protein
VPVGTAVSIAARNSLELKTSLVRKEVEQKIPFTGRPLA